MAQSGLLQKAGRSEEAWCVLCFEFLSDARRSPREGYADLKRCLLIPRLAIFDSRVCRGIPSLVAAPDGPEIRPPHSVQHLSLAKMMTDFEINSLRTGL